MPTRFSPPAVRPATVARSAAVRALRFDPWRTSGAALLPRCERCELDPSVQSVLILALGVVSHRPPSTLSCMCRGIWTS